MLDSVFRILKVTVIIAVASAFMLAINAILALIISISTNNVIGEVIGIMSCCLPFNALAVIGGLLVACNAILSFLIAKKIFDLTSWSVSAI